MQQHFCQDEACHDQRTADDTQNQADLRAAATACTAADIVVLFGQGFHYGNHDIRRLRGIAVRELYANVAVKLGKRVRIEQSEHSCVNVHRRAVVVDYGEHQARRIERTTDCVR